MTWEDSFQVSYLNFIIRFLLFNLKDIISSILDGGREFLVSELRPFLIFLLSSHILHRQSTQRKSWQWIVMVISLQFFVLFHEAGRSLSVDLRVLMCDRFDFVKKLEKKSEITRFFSIFCLSITRSQYIYESNIYMYTCTRLNIHTDAHK